MRLPFGLKKRHVPRCERCNRDDFEMVMNGVCNGCYKRAFEKDVMQVEVFIGLMVILILVLDYTVFA